MDDLVVVQFEDALCATGTTKQRALELSLYPNNERVTLLSNLPNADDALYVEQQVEKRLGIVDRPVEGEIPRV